MQRTEMLFLILPVCVLIVGANLPESCEAIASVDQA